MDYRSKVNDSLKYIEKNLDDKISLQDLAQKANLSKYYYHRIFHKIVGQSAARYINKRRMEKASEELIHTNQSILDIALKYQYGSQESFSRAFRRIYGLTPGKYRRVYGSNKSNNVISIRTYLNKITNIAA